MATSPIILILGAGENVGFHVASSFAKNGYKVAVASRSEKSAVDAADLYVKADFSDPESIKGVFEQVKEKLGAPSVVVYNAYAVHRTEDPISLPVSALIPSIHVNITSLYAAAQESISAFASLAPSTPGTFIFTGNCLNVKPMPRVTDLGLGKAAAAYVVEVAANWYGEKGYRFYYADERYDNGLPIANDLSGEEAANYYLELAKKKEQGPWHQTYVKGKGYVEFPGREVLTY